MKRFVRGNMLGNGIWSLADQGIISATNFATMVLIARSLSPSSFGVFTLAYTVLLFANTIQSALITQPHNVLAAALGGRSYTDYTTAAAIAQFLLALVLGAVVLLVGGLLYVAGWDGAPLVVALAPAVGAWQCQEFIRKAMYTRSQIPAAFSNDLVSYGGQVVGIAALWNWGHLSATSAIAVIALTSSIAVCFGVWQIRQHLIPSFRFNGIVSVAHKNWSIGKWLLGSALASWTSGQLYPVLTAGLVNVTATGALRATQTILGPTHIVLKATESLFLPKMAVAHASGGTPAVGRLTQRMCLITLPPIATFCIGIALFSRTIMGTVYGVEYQSYGWLLMLMSFNYILVHLTTPVSVALRGMGVTAPMFRAYVWSTIVVLTVGIAAVVVFGLAGAAFGLILHSIILNVVLWRCYYSHIRIYSGVSTLGYSTVTIHRLKDHSLVEIHRKVSA